MANTYIKGVSGGETTAPTGAEGVPLDDGTTSTWIKLTTIYQYALNYIHSVTAKTTVTGADELALIDSAASNVGKKITYTNFKAQLISDMAAGYSTRVQFTRPSDTTAYGAGDVVGITGGGTASMTFTIGAGAGEYMITSTRLQRNATALISGETSYTLHLFNVTQPSAQADNAVFDVASGDQASYLGSINLGTPVDIGSTLAVEQNGVNKQVTLASANIYGVLVTVGAYTPASAAVYVVELHAVGL